MTTGTTKFDAILENMVQRDPDPSGLVKSFSGTLNVNILNDDPVALTGELRLVNGRILGSLKIGSSAFTLPVVITVRANNSLTGGPYTFVLPQSEYPNDLPNGNGFFFINSISGTVDAAFSDIDITFDAGSIVYDPAANAATATVAIDEVVTPFVPKSFEVPGDSQSWTAETVSAPFEVKVNQIMNPFENWGSLMDVTRLPGEENPSFAKRIQEARVRRGGSSYQGLINAITRDLGLKREDAIHIRRKPSFDGDMWDTMIRVVDNHLQLYRRYVTEKNKSLDIEVDLRAKPRLADVVADINSRSSVFKAGLLADGQAFSHTLLNQENHKLVQDEAVPMATNFRLRNKNLKLGSVTFSDRDVFLTEQSSLSAVVADGDYYVDYVNGFVYTFNMPDTESTVTYRYIEIPFKLERSEVVVNDVNSRSFRKHFFTQVAQDLYDDPELSTLDGRPTAEMFKAIDELLHVSDVYWGP